MALGASRANVLGLVIRRGVAYAGAGIAAGAVAALFLTRLMEGLLYGVAPRDPLTFAAVALLLLGDRGRGERRAGAPRRARRSPRGAAVGVSARVGVVGAGLAAERRLLRGDSER